MKIKLQETHPSYQIDEGEIRRFKINGDYAVISPWVSWLERRVKFSYVQNIVNILKDKRIQPIIVGGNSPIEKKYNRT